MSHSHRDDADLAFLNTAQDDALEPVAKRSPATNAELAAAAAAAREQQHEEEEEAPPEVVRERKFLGDGDTSPRRPSGGAPATDDDVDALSGRAWATKGPPPPRFESHADQTAWLGDYRFETLGFADPLRSGLWVRTTVASAAPRMSARGGWVRP